MYIVYVLLNPLKPGNYQYGRLKFGYEPFYVGMSSKGERRINKHLQEAEIFLETKECFSKNLHKVRTIVNIWRAKQQVLFRTFKKQCLDSCFEYEQHVISLIGRRATKTGPLTNLTDGGEGTCGQVRSKEYKQRMSQRIKQLYVDRPELKEEIGFRNSLEGMSEEHYKKMLEGHARRRTKHSAETKRKISQAGIGRKHSEETRAKIALANSLRVITDETKQKISKARTGKKAPEWFGKYISECNSGSKRSDETKQKMREAWAIRRAKGPSEKEQQAIERNRTRYWVIPPKGKKILVRDLASFCDKHGLSIHCMRKIACGNQIQHKGWVCKNA